MKKILAALALVAALTACTEFSPPQQAVPELTFDQVQPVSLNVARIVTENKYRAPMKKPYVDHLFATPPDVAAQRLVNKQLKPDGVENTLKVTIQDASVVAEDQPLPNGITGLFTRIPPQVLKAKVVLHFEMVNDAAPDIILGHADVVATRSGTVTENASPAERDQAYFDLTEQLMDDVSGGLETTVFDTFGKK